MRTVARLLRACASLPPLVLQYVDYALWQRSEALAPHLASHRSYWRSALREGDLPVLELPLDYPRPAVQTFAGDAVPLHVGGDVVSRLEALGRACGVVGCTLFQLVLAVWCVVLCRHAGQEEVVVGSPYHGRDASGTEGLIGYFVNMLALRVEVGWRWVERGRRGARCCVCGVWRDAPRVGAVPVDRARAAASPCARRVAQRLSFRRFWLGGDGAPACLGSAS